MTITNHHTALFALFATFLAACKTTPATTPLVPVDSYTFASATTKTTTPWWQSFKNRDLDRLVAKALEKNLGLAVLTARIFEADASLRSAHGQLFPSLDASSAFRSRWSDSDATPSGSSQTPSLGALLNYEADVWGRLRSGRNAARAGQRASVADWHAARLLLSAAVTGTYFGILEQQHQLELANGQIETGQTLLGLTELRFGQGQSSVVDVLQQREQLAGTTARIPLIRSRHRQLELALDTLLSQPPTATSIRSRPFAPPPPRLATGVPSDLLTGRPDLVAARQRLGAIDHSLAAAAADRLPRFTIGIDTSASRTSSINSLVTNTVADLAAPLFDAGVRSAEVDRQRARLDAALAEYSQSYLAAVRDVETALYQEKQQAERVRLVEKQLTVATALFTESRNRYSQGLTDYLPVLNAVTTQQSLQRDVITERFSWLGFRVALHRALGGPLPVAKSPPPAQ